MRRMTEKLIDRVLGARRQLSICPTACTRGRTSCAPPIRASRNSSRKKRSYDPQLRFRNMMWEKYFA